MPIASAAVGALALAVVLGLAGITWQWRRAEAHADEVERQRLQAKLAFDRAHAAVLAFTRLGRDGTLVSPEGKRVRDELIRVALDYYREVVAAGRDRPALLTEVAMADVSIFRHMPFPIAARGYGVRYHDAGIQPFDAATFMVQWQAPLTLQARPASSVW